LVEILFTLGSFGPPTKYHINKAMENANLFVEEEFNYQKIKRAIYNLVQSGLIERTSKRTSLEIVITQMGLDRISELIPHYRIHRPWDKYIYLISYDIPTQNNHSRNKLRLYLKKIGCGMLQESLWLTPYNPTTILSDFVSKFDIPGTILVSKLGHDGSIGEEGLPDLISKVYDYNSLNDKYDDFILKYKTDNQTSNFQIYMEYLKILKTDPQLPYELEPDGFTSKKAYELVKSRCPNLTSI